MKKDEVKIGETYRCQVSGSTAEVRIAAENPNGGWDAVNVQTNRKVRIKSAQRLRTKTPQRMGQRTKADAPTKTKAKTAPKDDVAKTTEAVEKGDRTDGVRAPAGKKQSGKKKTAKADRQKRPSGLDAAAQVLADAGKPMNCKTIVERMLAKGLWQTKGKTPAATIYAAIIREIATKGKDARFRKVERGQFKLAKVG